MQVVDQRGQAVFDGRVREGSFWWCPRTTWWPSKPPRRRRVRAVRGISRPTKTPCSILSPVAPQPPVPLPWMCLLMLTVSSLRDVPRQGEEVEDEQERGYFAGAKVWVAEEGLNVE
ncbi:hypothetical protein RHMOL_Rhmol13G0043700 [Rhododendron molle]|uniref:Uncharacterized protein n=1 Tax=Rhododendron molle TaxID=49168 RepID=A0ACC0L3Z6_RHOML|nr:hypothetical protein RHMOL_Rhmol13G0043700 [Rhododendron molle]